MLEAPGRDGPPELQNRKAAEGAPMSNSEERATRSDVGDYCTLGVIRLLYSRSLDLRRRHVAVTSVATPAGLLKKSVIRISGVSRQRFAVKQTNASNGPLVSAMM